LFTRTRRPWLKPSIRMISFITSIRLFFLRFPSTVSHISKVVRGASVPVAPVTVMPSSSFPSSAVALAGGVGATGDGVAAVCLPEASFDPLSLDAFFFPVFFPFSPRSFSRILVCIHPFPLSPRPRKTRRRR
ncbi:hypothetical protein PMAYCL1PPCAC_19199, partial [Pristionchus mayeri]